MSTNYVNYSSVDVPYTFDIFYIFNKSENFWYDQMQSNLPGLTKKTKRDLKKMYIDINKK